jgi:hypothetical protein
MSHSKEMEELVQGGPDSSLTLKNAVLVVRRPVYDAFPSL